MTRTMPTSGGQQFSFKLQFIFFSIFVLLNAALFLNAVPVLHDTHDLDLTHPVYAGAADGQRYWGVAKNLTERGTFHYALGPDKLVRLKRGGPIPPIVFAGLMSLSSFENAPLLIIGFQALLLFATSLLSRTLAAPFSISKNLVQGLVLFNPSLIGLVHHAQSEIVFLFFFTSILFFSIKLLTGNQSDRYSFIGIGICTGLLLLTRPAGLFFVISLPLLLSLAVYFSQKEFSQALKTVRRQIVPACLVTTLMAAPWGLYNYLKFGDTGFISGAGSVLSFNHYLLANASASRTGTKSDQRTAEDLIDQAVARGISACCTLFLLAEVSSSRFGIRSHQRVPEYLIDSAVAQGISSDCALSGDLIPNFSEGTKRKYSCGSIDLSEDYQDVLASLHIGAIKSYGLADWSHALLRAWISTFIGGGISPIAQYMQIRTPDTRTLNKEYRGPLSFGVYFLETITASPGYALLFMTGVSFALICRFLGIVGFLSHSTNRTLLPYNILYVGCIAIFTATYLFIGVSRFRAHLEPILAIYGVLGITILLQRSKRSQKR